jgi:hypothetical protein
MAAERNRVPRISPAAAAPLAVVVLGIIAGLITVVIGHWRLGCLIIGAFLAFGGIERLLLPKDSAGLLQARSRFFDVIALLGMGVMIIVLAIIVPNGK